MSSFASIHVHSRRLVVQRTKLKGEGARILGEDIDIYIVYLDGYGFPAWRSGPMFYADTVGLKNVLAKIEEFDQRHCPDLWARPRS